MELTLRPSLFWDTDVKKIDLHKHQAYIIERITMRGRIEEFRAMLQYYERETIKKVLINARHLDKKTLSFCSALFKLPINQFRCYKLGQLNPKHWNY